MIYYLIAFFLSFGALFADEDSTVATLANDPSTIPTSTLFRPNIAFHLNETDFLGFVVPSEKIRRGN